MDVTYIPKEPKYLKRYEENLNYKDILLTPVYSELESRTEADTSVQLGGHKFDLPIIPANMRTVIDEDLAIWLAKRNLPYVMHRFGVDSYKFNRMMHQNGLVSSISLGVNKDSYETVDLIAGNGSNPPHFITIDIAHGHCVKMKKMLEYTKEKLPKSFIIAGNVATPEATIALESWGADAIKVGIGPGSVCTTKLKTGFSCPQFSAVLKCSRVAKKPIIADGGIEHNGDIAKALVAGATMIMAGGIFAGYDESPGEHLIQIENGQEVHYKQFYGSASEHNKGEKRNVEGRRILIPLRGPIEDKIIELKQDLQSSISYAGGKNISAFYNIDWVIVK